MIRRSGMCRGNRLAREGRICDLVQTRHACVDPSSVTSAPFVGRPILTYTDHSASVQAQSPRSNAMFRKSASLIVAIATLALASPLATGAAAQERPRDRDEQPSQPQRPRVSPDEARRSAGQYGRPIDTQPRRDGNYSVLVERGGQVRDVTVDGRTGQARQGGNNSRDNNDQRPRPD